MTSWKIPQPLTLGSGPGRPLSPSPRGCGVRYEGRIGDYAGEEEGSPGGVSGRRLLCNSGSSGIQLECTRGLWVFDGVKPRDQKAALQNYRWFAKHGWMACIFINDKVIGFASIYWNEDLSKQPPVRCPVGRRSQRHQCPHLIQNRKQREDGPDRYLALRLQTSPEGNTRHQERAASGRADFLQAASLVTWLTQKVSLIQGPPGEFLRTGYASSTRI